MNKQIMENLFPQQYKILNKIEEFTCMEFNIPQKNTNENNKNRKQPFATIRHIVWYIGKKNTNLSSTQLGYMYWKNHASVLCGIKTIENINSVDKNMRNKINNIQNKINDILTKQVIESGID